MLEIFPLLYSTYDEVLTGLDASSTVKKTYEYTGKLLTEDSGFPRP
jgi:hypothetical protein